MHPEERPNPDRSPESLAARLRALPPPPVPADLEARLLAAVPPERPIPRRRWSVWVVVAGALAAACLVAVLAWPRRDGRHPVPGPEKSESARQLPPRPPDDSAGLAAWLEARRNQDEAEPATFSWPLPETSPVQSPTSIPPDLLD
jgi:hypothetical protein